MNPVALAIIADQHVADLRRHADAARRSHQPRNAQPRTRRPLRRRLIRLNRPEPRPRPETLSGPACSTGR